MRGNSSGDGAPRQRMNSTGAGSTANGSRRSANGVKPEHAPVSSRNKPSKRRKSSSLFRRTWSLPLALILGILSLYALNPTNANIIHPFLFLSYKLENQDGNPLHYGKGPADIAYVAFFTIVLSFTREFAMQEILKPLARACGIQSRKKQQRFTEQMYAAAYTAIVGPLGLHCMRQTPVWYFNTRGMYEDFPHTTHTAELKFYYLFQAAFWVQQGIVMALGVEGRRKDFRELVAHHIVTVALIGLSYRFHFTYMGIAVYVTHDISDFFLAISKSFNYVNSPAQGPSFAVCVSAWIYLRHCINLRILWSVLTDFGAVGPYVLDWETEQYKCYISNIITFVLLTTLQALNLFWLYCLLRTAYKFVFRGVAKDDRSDDEPVIDVVTRSTFSSQ